MRTTSENLAVIPAYNEGETIVGVIESILRERAARSTSS